MKKQKKKKITPYDDNKKEFTRWDMQVFGEFCRDNERERIINLFKEKSIYTGAVIKFEINNSAK